MVPVPVLVPAPYVDHKKKIFQKKILGIFFAFLDRLQGKRLKNFNKFIVKCVWKMLNEGNQINQFISSSFSWTVISNYGSGSDFLTSYGSGSTSQKVTVPVPVPQRCV